MIRRKAAAGTIRCPSADVEDVDKSEYRGVGRFRGADRAAERIGRRRLRRQKKAGYTHRNGPPFMYSYYAHALR